MSDHRQSIALPQLPSCRGAVTHRLGSEACQEAREAKEKCGIFGTWGTATPASLTYYGLYALQHRGQESAGIVVTDGSSLERHTGMGLVANVFDARALGGLDAIAHRRSPAGGAIGHNRYSTTGGSSAAHAQPMMSQIGSGTVAVAHNGNIVNASELRRELESRGHPFQTSTDTEVVLHLYAKADAELRGRPDADPLAAALRPLVGAFSLVFLFKDRLEAARDPWGWRPLVIGERADGRFVVASETVALDVADAKLVREVEPGEIVTIDDHGLRSRRFIDDDRAHARCIFEHVYLASPASRIFGKTVQLSRERMGERLAMESPAQADWIIPMPDSGRSAAVGYARASGIPFREGIIPNRYVGRSFIKPTGDQRVAAVRLKINVIEEAVRGQRIVIVDDSIVRGTTTRAKMKQLRDAGATAIHLRVASPPITHPCFFGIDFASPDELIARRMDTDAMAKELGVDSVRYLTLDGLHEVVGDDGSPAAGYCDACFTGAYPVPVDNATARDALAC